MKQTCAWAVVLFCVGVLASSSALAANQPTTVTPAGTWTGKAKLVDFGASEGNGQKKTVNCTLTINVVDETGALTGTLVAGEVTYTLTGRFGGLHLWLTNSTAVPAPAALVFISAHINKKGVKMTGVAISYGTTPFDVEEVGFSFKLTDS